MKPTFLNTMLKDAVSKLDIQSIKQKLNLISDAAFKEIQPLNNALIPTLIYYSILKYLEEPNQQYLQDCMDVLALFEAKGWDPKHTMQTTGIAKWVTSPGLNGHKLTYATFYDEHNHQQAVAYLLTEMFKRYGVEFTIDSMIDEYLNQFSSSQQVSPPKYIERCRKPFLHAFQQATGHAYHGQSVQDLPLPHTSARLLKPKL